MIRQPARSPHKMLVMALILTGYLLILLDVSIVMTAVPTIHRDFGFSAASLSWGRDAYVLVFGGLLLLGGVFTSWLSWPVGFFVNVPVGTVAMLAAPRYPPETERRSGRFDLAGAASSSLGVSAVVYGVVRAATTGWGNTPDPGNTRPGWAAARWFGSTSSGPHSRCYRCGCLPAGSAPAPTRRGFCSTARYRLFFFMTQYLHGVDGDSPIQAGLAFLPVSLVVFAAAAVVPLLTHRVAGDAATVLLVLALIIALITRTRTSARAVENRAEPTARVPPARPGSARRASRSLLAPNNPKERPMQITRNSLDTNPGPSEWFTGIVYIDAIASPSPPSRTGAGSVHFTPGARTAWHTHPFGQTIYVTEGIGRCQREGGPIEEIRPGDRVFFEPGENHWHGAGPKRFMTHIAMQEADDSGSPVTWGRHVTDKEYNAPPPRASA